MAGKSRRVASRQGELSRPQKAGPERPQRHPCNPGPSAAAGEWRQRCFGCGSRGRWRFPAVAQQAAPAPAPAAAERPAPQSSAGQNRGQARARGERPAAYNYVGAELRRIGILSTVVVAALIAISVVL